MRTLLTTLALGLLVAGAACSGTATTGPSFEDREPALTEPAGAEARAPLLQRAGPRNCQQSAYLRCSPRHCERL